MSLFKKKKVETTETTGCCSCNGACNTTAEHKQEGIITSIKVLGSGCANCNALEAATKEALHEIGLEIIIDHVTDFGKIAEYGVMSTPGLVINEKVVSFGRVLKKQEVMELIKKVQG